MSDVDDDAGEWSDYEGDDDCLDDDVAEEALDDDQESELDYDNGAVASIPGAGRRNQQVVSLKQNCLDCVVINFERFHQAFMSSGDPALLWNLKFLQRAYTSNIIKGLSLQGRLCDKYIDFLINESLKELDIGTFIDNRCSLKAIQERIVQVGHSFKKVLLKSPYCHMEENLSEFVSETVCHLKNVEIIDIPRHCNDETLKNISIFCTKLKELHIDYSSDVTEAGLELLCKDRDTECLIQVLSIKLVKLSNHATIKFLLKNMPYLEVLEFTYLPSILYSIHEEDLKNNTLETAKKYNLTKLDFSYSYDTKLELFLKVSTEVCPNIKTLNIHIRSEKELNLISRFSNLEDLTIATMLQDPREPRIDINNFLKSNGSRLKHLKLNRFSLSVSNLIQSCPKLENLTLSAVEFQKHATKRASSNTRLSSLHELCLEDITFSEQYAEDSVTDILLSSPNLERLSFKDCVFMFENSEINTKLAKYCEDCMLQYLRFNNCNVELALLESIILTCPSLTYLAIDSCENISYNDVSNLQMLRNTASGFINIVFRDLVSDDESYVYTDYDDFSDDYDHYSDDDYDLDDYDGYDAFEDHVLWFA
ncbi:hypothetical protein JTE90_009318 [Oedothorax gibbosus]|uniref:Uncharacterized protein n=1 Tax=Oedothorax gibbosus TaxID=931172 RepID=A0AAV6VS46_9ARAC|nr:hypothetical protein JTE90_009318 [Oedothorax gibbosus]